MICDSVGYLTKHINFSIYSHYFIYRILSFLKSTSKIKKQEFINSSTIPLPLPKMVLHTNWALFAQTFSSQPQIGNSKFQRALRSNVSALGRAWLFRNEETAAGPSLTMVSRRTKGWSLKAENTCFDVDDYASPSFLCTIRPAATRNPRHSTSRPRNSKIAINRSPAKFSCNEKIAGTSICPFRAALKASCEMQPAYEEETRASLAEQQWALAVEP